MRLYKDLSPTGKLFRRGAPLVLLYGGPVAVLYWACTKARKTAKGHRL